MDRGIRQLLGRGVISADQLNLAAMLQAKQGGTIGQHLVQMGAISAARLAAFFASAFSLPMVEATQLENVSAAVLRLVASELALTFRVLPWQVDGPLLHLATADPSQVSAFEEIVFQTGKQLCLYVCSEVDMNQALERYYRRPNNAIAADLPKGIHFLGQKPLNHRPALATEETLPGRPSSRGTMEATFLSRLSTVSNRDEVIDAALRLLLSYANRAAFFACKKNEIRGCAIRGEYTRDSAVRSFWIPASAASTFQNVAKSGSIYRGPIGTSSADGLLVSALGGRKGSCLIIPLEFRQRTAWLLYADGLAQKLPPDLHLRRIADVVEERLGVLLAQKAINRNEFR